MRIDTVLAVACLLALASAASVIGCDSSSDEAPSNTPNLPAEDHEAGAPQQGSFTLTAPGEVELVAGASVTIELTATRSGEAEDIALAISGLPAGVTAAPAMLAAGETHASVTLTAAASATQGPSGKVSITGTASSLATASAETAVFVRGAPGTLDASFGSAGIAHLPTSEVTVYAAAVQADSKILLGGRKADGTSRKGYLLRIDASGTPDPSFGASGGVLVDPGMPGDVLLTHVVLDPSGAVLANGYTRPDTGNNRALVARLDTSGKLDTSFNATGIYTTTFPGDEGARSTSSILQRDGSLVLVGEVPAGPRTWGAARVTPQGGTDATFGGGAVLPGPTLGALSCGGQQSDGKLLLGGAVIDIINSEYVPRWGFTRLALADGSVDTGYGAAGFSKIVWPVPSGVSACTLDAKDNVVAVGGIVESGIGEFMVARYDASASADQSFHAGAPVKIALGSGNAYPTGLFVESGGKLVVAGNSPAGLLTVVRLGPDGANDPTFATGGIFTASGGLSYLANVTYSALDGARRRVVLTGNAMAGAQGGVFVARVWL